MKRIPIWLASIRRHLNAAPAHARRLRKAAYPALHTALHKLHKPTPRMRKRMITLGLLLVGVLAFLALLVTPPAPISVRPPQRPALVAAETIEKRAVSPTVRLFGHVETPTLSEITAAIQADVVEVRVREGNRVEKGELLVVLDDADVNLTLRQRKTEAREVEADWQSARTKHATDIESLKSETKLLEIAEREVERARELAQSQAGSEATLDSALKALHSQRLSVLQRRQAIDDFAAREIVWRARLERATASVRRAERDRERSRIRAPFAGRIVEVSVSEGDRVGPASKLFQLYDDTELEVRAQVPSRHVDRLRRALDAGHTIYAALEDAEMYAETPSEQGHFVLARLAANIAEGSGGVDAFFHLDGLDTPELGRTLSMQLTMPPVEGAVLLGLDALYGNDRVYLISDNELRALHTRQIGYRNERGKVRVVLDGAVFNNGDLVLSSRLPQAIDGLSVEVAK